MASNASSSDNVSIPESSVSRKIAITRFFIGLVQGVLLYVLYDALQQKTWPATDGQIFAPLLLVSLFIPIILVSGFGHIGAKRFVMWIAAATIITCAMGFYDIWRLSPEGTSWFWYGSNRHGVMPSLLMFFFTGIGLYIAHSLVLAATADKRWIASYPSYFEAAWKLAVQIKFSAMFVGILWLILWLGASLFMLIKLDFLEKLLQESWFSIPITAFAFSSAFHITDVRPGIVRGIRTLLLVLMSWLLPLATLIVLGFMASLIWTGLAPLWATRHATTVLLIAAAVLVLLINAAFQNGEIASQLARVLRWSGRIAAVLLTPIVLIAIYSLGLRVGDYGWTTDRVIAAACLLVASCYAGGYAWAAFSRGEWLHRIAPTNVATAFLILAVLLGIFSPLADPARISVANQLARLESAEVLAAKFDFDYLKFSGERYGWDALQKLKGHTGAEAGLVQEKAVATIAKSHRGYQQIPAATASEIADNISVWPQGRTLPKQFLEQNWGRAKRELWLFPKCLSFKDKKCDAYLIDFTGDGKVEILFIDHQVGTRPALMMQSTNGAWDIIGSLDESVKCRNIIRKNLVAGSYRLIAPLIQDLEVAGQRLHVARNQGTSGECLGADSLKIGKR